MLRRMAQEGMITDADRDRLIALPVTPNPNPIRRGKSHLYELIAKQANQLVGEEALSQGGYIIRTTIDLACQNKVEESLRAQLEEAESGPGYQHQTYQDFDPGSKKSPDYIQGSALMVDHTTGEVWFTWEDGIMLIRNMILWSLDDGHWERLSSLLSTRQHLKTV